MKKVTLSIELTLVAPFLTKSTDIGGFGIDAPFAKSTDGKFKFPGKLIKGCLRQAIEEISDVINNPEKDEIEKWFGDKSEYEKDQTKTSVEPKRGKLFFSDFITDEKGEKKTITKISIDSERGAVKENHLLVIESPFKPQEEITFKGKITYFAIDDNDYKKIKNWINKGLNWITNLGALENINFGQLKKVKFTNDNQETKQIQFANQTATGAQTSALIIKPKEPFCISKRRTTENLFESEEFISGGVLKGCLAETLKLISDDNNTDFNKLRENLDRIRFTHTFPSSSKVRPVVAPLSLVKIEQPAFFDVASQKEAILLGGDPQSPAFSVDWKKFDDVDSAFGWEHPKTVLSVQTAIENSKAKDGQLFAYEKINPEGFEWLGRVDLSNVKNDVRSEIEKQMRCVFEQNLFGLGKTKAECEIRMVDDSAITNKKDSYKKPKDNKFIITLQSPFLLCDPTELDVSSGKNELHNAYQSTWENLFDNSATLSHFFASQSLAGGEYLHKRFQSSKPYNPFILTDAGSVFVFDVSDEVSASERIDKWLRHGLPLPDWAVELYLKNVNERNYWQYLPFLPENGFGEIAVNLDVHWDNVPTEVAKI